MSYADGPCGPTRMSDTEDAAARAWQSGDRLAPGDPTGLDAALELLARRGWWIVAWYPFTSGTHAGRFECRITAAGAVPATWAVEDHAVDALVAAMSKAGLR